MKRRHLVLIGGLLGCDPAEPSQTVFADWAWELEGTWQVEAVVSSNCPTEVKRALPMGQTIWKAEGEQLQISDRHGHQSIQVWAQSEMMFEDHTTLTVYGCEVTEDLQLILDDKTEHWAQGRFVATVGHDGSRLCEELAADLGLPDDCQTETIWKARRLSGS